MLLLKPFPTIPRGKISLPAALGLARLLAFAARPVATPSAFGGDGAIVFVGNKTKGLNPRCLACTSAK